MITDRQAFLLALNCNIEELEKKTRGQSQNPVWKQERKKRLTASNFGNICSMKETTDPTKLVKRLSTDIPIFPAIAHGLKYEDSAIEKYSQIKNVKVEKCGLFVCPGLPFLACSPDGLILNENAILEVKCPFSGFENPPEQLPKIRKNFYCRLDSSGKLILKKTHPYYYQIQGMLNITNKQYCDFIVYTFGGISVERIEKDVFIWKNMVEKLKRFYFNYYLPHVLTEIVRN